MTVGAARVGFIGLGHMGHGMAINILKRGFPLHVMAHKNRKALDDVVYRGAQEVSTPKAMAASCDIVLLCVPGAKEVKALVAGDDGLAAGSRPGLTIVDCTTSDPSTLLRLSAEYAPRGLVFVDAPLGRSPHEAWQGALSTMVGGELSTLERIRPVLAAFATTIQHAGALGNGHRLKLVNNLISLGYAALYSEALALAVKPGSTPRPSTTSCAQAVCTVRSMTRSLAGSSRAIVKVIPTRSTTRCARFPTSFNFPGRWA